MVTKEILRQFIRQELLAHQDSAEIHDEDNLLESGMIDSLGIMRLVAFVEEKFGMKVAYEDITIDNFQSIDAIFAYVAAREET
jgi:acyl carrier protein